MKVSTLQATNKGQLHKSNRKAIPIRLLPEQHAELKKTSATEIRSMGFIALRRYQAGLQLEQSKQPT